MLRNTILAVAFAAATVAQAANPQVEFDTTAGVIKVELYPEAAPKTVANFLDYVKSKHYDGTQFHRVIDGFMVQGGGFTTDFKQKPTKPPFVIESESSSKAGLSNVAGHAGDGPHQRPQFGDVAVLHQRQRQPRLNFSAATPQGYRLHGVRQGGRRHGRGQQDRQGDRRARQARCRPASIPPTCRHRRSSSSPPRSSAADTAVHEENRHGSAQDQSR